MSRSYVADPCPGESESDTPCTCTLVTRLGYCLRCGAYRHEYDQETSFGAAERARPNRPSIESEWRT